MEQLAKKEMDNKVARPLRVLVPLIQDDLKHGQEAAEKAAMPYYIAAGEKLLEAKAQLKHSEFMGWAARNFTVKLRQLEKYMAIAALNENRPAVRFSSIGDFMRRTGTNPNYNTAADRTPAWPEPVKDIIDRVDTETLNLKREELKRADERDAQRKLALLEKARFLKEQQLNKALELAERANAVLR